MAQEIKENGTEPVLAIGVTKVMWILVAAIIWLAYIVTGFSDHVEKIVIKRAEALISIIDHELDDSNDNAESMLELIMENKIDACREVLANFRCGPSGGGG